MPNPVRNAATKDELQKRLRRIEGQVRGVGKMLADDRDCHEIIQQLAAVRSAVQQASMLVVRSYAAQCLLEPQAGEDQRDVIEDLISVLSRST